MEVWKKERGNGWRKRLLKMRVDQVAYIEFKSKETVRSIISRDIFDKYPEYLFETKKVEFDGVKYLEVRRIK